MQIAWKGEERSSSKRTRTKKRRKKSSPVACVNLKRANLIRLECHLFYLAIFNRVKEIRCEIIDYSYLTGLTSWYLNLVASWGLKIDSGVGKKKFKLAWRLIFKYFIEKVIHLKKRKPPRTIIMAAIDKSHRDCLPAYDAIIDRSNDSIS